MREVKDEGLAQTVYNAMVLHRRICAAHDELLEVSDGTFGACATLLAAHAWLAQVRRRGDESRCFVRNSLHLERLLCRQIYPRSARE